MSVWVRIEHAKKDGTRYDLWGTDMKDPAPGKGGIMIPCYWARHTDCFWGTPHYVTTSGLLMPAEEGWYYMEAVNRPRRVWPTHFMEIPSPPKESA